MYVKPYNKISGNICLAFVLDAKRFAKSCRYDLPLALIRLPIHYREYEAKGFLDQFYNEVRLVCLEHHQSEVDTNHGGGLITPRK